MPPATELLDSRIELSIILAWAVQIIGNQVRYTNLLSKRLLDAFFYQDARPQGNFGRAFLLPLTGSDTPYRRCRDWGRDGLVCAEAKQKGCHRGRGRRHRAGGLKISGRPSEVPLPGGRRHWAGGSCCSTGPANLAGSPEAAGQMARPLLRMAGGVSCHAAGRFHRGGGLSFPLCSRSPWRAGESR